MFVPRITRLKSSKTIFCPRITEIFFKSSKAGSCGFMAPLSLDDAGNPVLPTAAHAGAGALTRPSGVKLRCLSLPARS